MLDSPTEYFLHKNRFRGYWGACASESGVVPKIKNDTHTESQDKPRFPRDGFLLQSRPRKILGGARGMNGSEELHQLTQPE